MSKLYFQAITPAIPWIVRAPAGVERQFQPNPRLAMGQSLYASLKFISDTMNAALADRVDRVSIAEASQTMLGLIEAGDLARQTPCSWLDLLDDDGAPRFGDP